MDVSHVEKRAGWRATFQRRFAGVLIGLAIALVFDVGLIAFEWSRFTLLFPESITTAAIERHNEKVIKMHEIYGAVSRKSIAFDSPGVVVVEHPGGAWLETGQVIPAGLQWLLEREAGDLRQRKLCRPCYRDYARE